MIKAQTEIRTYLKERNWDKLKPVDLAKSISIESAELLEIFQWKDLSIKELKANPEKLQALKDEIADICIYAIEMGIILNEDIEEIILQKLEKVKKKYPVELIKGRNNENYFKIKKEYRKNA